MKTITGTRRFYQIDLKVLAPLNPGLTIPMMYDMLVKEFVSAVEIFQDEMNQQENSSILLDPQKERFTVILINYAEPLEKKILWLLDYVVSENIPVVPGKSYTYKSRYRYTDWK